MFNKPFRVKSNVALRSSERKRILNQVKQLYSTEENEEQLSGCFSSKEETNVVKIQTHKGKSVTIYTAQKDALFFELDNRLFPTLPAIWRFNIRLPALTTHLPVIPKLANGADLMLPGVVLPQLIEQWISFAKGAIVGINTEENITCLSLGITLMSSEDMLHNTDRHGKAVQIVHNFGDHLWAFGEKVQPPIVKPTMEENIMALEQNSKKPAGFETVEAAEQISILPENTQTTEDTTPTINECEEEEINSKLQKVEINSNIDGRDVHESQNAIYSETVDAKPEPELMDDLLEFCFLNGLKGRLKDKDLPILASTFFRNHVLPSCPADKTLEIKKTTFKKFGKYLKHVAEIKLVEVKELSKGNDSIVAVNRGHDLYRAFKLVTTKTHNDEGSTSNTESYCGVITQKTYEPPEVSVVYGVNHATKDFFALAGVKKGAVFASGDIRQLVTTYIKENDLGKGRMVTLDPILHNVVCGKGQEDTTEVPWDHLFRTLLSKMQLSHKITFKGTDPIIKKGEPPTVNIATQVRTGNKKVTLVKNLEAFYIDPQQFADIVRKQAQASTSLSTVPGSNPKSPMQQVLIQGNQVSCVESILTGDRYKLASKFLMGLENAPKKKGKGKR
uniref:Eukaryotic translation initiation factor 2D-like n=1 Tax=Phallusia mammillata TaxID=59560 RepID=A0A6F9DCE5_9ASCI|nr:eukaryotic translation initiation factor 2D-like [Phallusia mammillata]